MISPGSIYASQELGWFRITFTVGEDALQEGLSRVWKTLDQIQAEDWNQNPISSQ